MQVVSTFHDLIVWQKGHLLALEIYKLTRSFPNDEKFGLCAQIRRSAASICANIAEGYKKKKGDYLRFLDIARGSLEETKYHLLLAKDLDYISSDQYSKLFELSDEVGRILYGFSQKLR